MAKMGSLADHVRRIAYWAEKVAVPEIHTEDGKDADLFFEHLDQEAKDNVLKDLIDERGNPRDIEVTLPDFPVSVGGVPVTKTVRGIDISEEGLRYLKFHIGKKLHGHPIFMMDYDPILHKYFQIEPEHAVPQLQYALRQPDPVLKTAKTGVSYSKGCAMVPAPEDVARSVMAYGVTNIPDKDLYTKEADQGRENDIHITLFYGFTEDEPEKLAEILKGIKPFTVRLGLVNAFKDEKDYDVLKITAESAELEKLHYLLEKKMKNDNKHPTYCAHLTVAYVKKGKADKLIGDDRFKGIEFQVDHIVYSDKDKNRTSIQFG